jgi:hypothetical protein
MSKLRIEHGVSRVKRAKLQVSIEQAVASDVELMAAWSNNEPPYIVNELLRFAIAQSKEFQRYKTELSKGPAPVAASAKPGSAVAKPVLTTEQKTDTSPSGAAVRA